MLAIDRIADEQLDRLTRTSLNARWTRGLSRHVLLKLFYQLITVSALFALLAMALDLSSPVIPIAGLAGSIYGVIRRANQAHDRGA